MAKPVAWGILGAATIARKCVIPALLASSRCQVRVLGSRDPKSAAKWARGRAIEHVVEGYDAVLADPAVEAVYIPLPNHMHLPWTIKALEAGKHVLCEKPIACTASEATAMVAAAADANRLLMEAFMYRFHPRSRRIHHMVTSGTIGTLRMVRAAFCFSMPKEILAAGEDFRLHSQTGGGALMDVGCYGVSTARWFFGRQPKAVQAQAVFNTHGVDLSMTANLKFEDGGLGAVACGFTSTLQQTYTLVGERAAIDLPHNAYVPWEKDAHFKFRGVDQEQGETITVAGADEYRIMVAHFADAVRGRSALVYDPQDSIDNMRVLDALARAARSGETVLL